MAIAMLPPARVMITEGLDQLRCVRLSPDGLHRWYAGCCRTPIGNSRSRRVPFVGLMRVFMDLDESARSILGDPIGVQARFAGGRAPRGAHARAPLSLILRAASKLLRWWLTRQGKPSPFFDATGAPAAEPHVLGSAERDALAHKSEAPASS